MRTQLLVVLAAGLLSCTWAVGSALADDVSHPQTAGQLSPQQMIFLSSNLSDLRVCNQKNDKLGSLDDLVIDGHTGQLMYGILKTGLLGKKVIVPWNAFRIEKTVGKDEYSLLLNIDKDRLAQAPTFDKKHLPDVTNAQWRQTVDNFFGVHTVARPTVDEPEEYDYEYQD